MNLFSVLLRGCGRSARLALQSFKPGLTSVLFIKSCLFQCDQGCHNVQFELERFCELICFINVILRHATVDTNTDEMKLINWNTNEMLGPVRSASFWNCD